MFRSMMQKLSFLYKPYALAILSIGYVLAELGHYVIGKSIDILYSLDILII